jgi:oxalate decarboxylase
VNRSRSRSARAGDTDPGPRNLTRDRQNPDLLVLPEGQACVGVFAASGQARTFDFLAGDVGYVPFATTTSNTGTKPLRFLEIFKSNHYADVSLSQWLALTPPEWVQAHLKLDAQTLAAFHKNKSPVVPAS